MLVAVAIAAGAWACSSDVASTIGDAMVDAGEAVRDAATDDAGAQVAIEAPCSIERTYVQRYEHPTGTWSETTTTNWYAEIRLDAATSSASEVGGVLCGYERFGTSDACDLPNYTCTGDRPLPPLDCIAAGPEFAAGVVRVWCGYRQTSTSSAAPTTSQVQGFRRTMARLYAR